LLDGQAQGLFPLPSDALVKIRWKHRDGGGKRERTRNGQQRSCGGREKGREKGRDGGREEGREEERQVWMGEASK